MITCIIEDLSSRLDFFIIFFAFVLLSVDQILVHVRLVLLLTLPKGAELKEIRLI